MMTFTVEVEFLKTVFNFNNAKEEISTTVSEDDVANDAGTEEEGNRASSSITRI